MSIPTMDGVTAEMITTARIRTRVLFFGEETGTPILFIHGNVSSATWWEEVMIALPDGFRGIAYDQRGYGDADPDKKIDATRGMGDLADDAIALLDHLQIEKTHLVGLSLGSSVVWQLMMDAPERFLTVTQISPGSPFGFGATKDNQGTPTTEDFAGSGAGLVNPEVVRLMAENERGTESPFAPRNALRGLWDASVVHPREEEWLSALLATHTGDKEYAGDVVPSPNWPGFAPGKWGANNALSPKYLDPMDRLYAIDPKPPVLWIRGANDKVVADQSLADIATYGQMGVIPNYPGVDVFPQQPMIGQTRAVLDHYRANGGQYEEVVLDGAGHVPYVEKPDEFNTNFHAHIQSR